MKSASIKTQINLGVFALSVAMIAALCIILAGDEISFFRRSRIFQANFDDTAGLVAGAPVRMGGVEVGRVTKIVIDPQAQGLTIAASLRIDHPFFELIRNDASVALDTQGLLGDKFIALYAGIGSGQLAVGELIRTRENGGMAMILAKSVDIMASVSSSVKKIDAFTSGLPDANALKSVIEDFAVSGRAMRILMAQITARDSFLSKLNDVESRALLHNTLANMESATSRVDAISKKIDSGQGTLGALINDRTLYEDLSVMLGHADRGKIARRVFIEAGSKEKSSPSSLK